MSDNPMKKALNKINEIAEKNPEQYAMPGTDEHKSICEAAEADWMARGGKLSSATAKHTPGPYRLESGGRIVSGDKTIAEIRDMNTEEGKANAALFLAAPDMAEALKALIAGAQGPICSDALASELLQARAALAKAGVT